MPEFQNKLRHIAEFLVDGGEVLPRFRLVRKIPPELREQMLQTSRIGQRRKSLVKSPDHVVDEHALMRDFLVKLGGEVEPTQVRRLPQPRFRVLLRRRAVERAVDLDHVHIAGNESQFVLHAAIVDVPVPVRVRPSCNPHADSVSEVFHFSSTEFQPRMNTNEHG